MRIRSGDSFGVLTVLDELKPMDRRMYFLCVCICGNKRKIRSDHLKDGHTKGTHCVCHGEHKTHLYGIWVAMKGRCSNEKDPGYKNYGGRGIKVSSEWQYYLNFKADIYKQYINHLKKYGSKNTQMDRKDNNGDYCKKNVRFATRKIQCRNKRTNKLITYKGQTKTMAEWMEIYNFPRNIIYERLKAGWSVEKTFTQKVKVQNKRRHYENHSTNQNFAGSGYFSIYVIHSI